MRFFMYYEDNNLYKKALALNLTNFYISEYCAIHDHYATVKALAEIKKYQESIDIGYDCICSTYNPKTFFSKPGYNPKTVKSIFDYLINWFNMRLNKN